MSDCPMLISNKLHSFRNFVIQMLCLTTTECHQRHEMILSVGKLLLRLFYTSQGFVEAFNSGLTYHSIEPLRSRMITLKT